MSTSTDGTWWIGSKYAFRFPVTAGNITFQVSFYVDDEHGFWHGGWIGPDGVPVTGWGLHLDDCKDDISPRIAAAWEKYAAAHPEVSQ